MPWWRHLPLAPCGSDWQRQYQSDECQWIKQGIDKVKTAWVCGNAQEKDPKPIDDKASLDIEQQIKLIRHLWLELHALGAVRNESEQALASYIKNQTQTAIDDLDGEQASNIIERLKNWRKRVEKPNQHLTKGSQNE